MNAIRILCVGASYFSSESSLEYRSQREGAIFIRGFAKFGIKVA